MLIKKIKDNESFIIAKFYPYVYNDRRLDAMGIRNNPEVKSFRIINDRKDVKKIEILGEIINDEYYEPKKFDDDIFVEYTFDKK